MKHITILGLTTLTLLVSACGIRGDLERPPPLWGPDNRTEAEREHEQDDAPEENDGS